MANKSKYRIPGVGGFKLGDGKMVSPDKDGVYSLDDGQVLGVKALGYEVCSPDQDVNQPANRPKGPDAEDKKIFRDPNQTDAKMGKATPRAQVAKMTGLKARPKSKYPAEMVTVYPDAANKKKKVVVVEVEGGDDVVNPNLTAKQVGALLKEYGLRLREINVSKTPWGEEVEEKEDETPEAGELTATIYPGTKDGTFTVVLDDGDGNPEVHVELDEKAVAKVVEAAGLDSKDPKEVIESKDPYTTPEKE